MKSSMLIVVALCALTAPIQGETLTLDGVRVTYEGIEKKHASAMARVLTTARQVYIKEFGFDMPETIDLKVDCGPDHASRLYTDGVDRIILSMPSTKNLNPPAQSGTFTLYGLCHELGHIAMYRTLKERDWMSGAAAEGWAHYAGSVVVDRVYKAHGASLWSTPYRYLNDGTARLKRQLSATRPSAVARAAGAWRDMGTVIGETSYVKVFKAWQDAKIDATSPNDALLEKLKSIAPEQADKLATLWKDAAPLLVSPRQASDVAKETLDASKLSGQPLKVSGDDGTAEGRKSIAGGGHARRFKAPEGAGWFLSAVSFHGARYGRAQKSDTFEIALCDRDLKPIASWKHSYLDVKSGKMEWSRFTATPTRVPDEFYICLRFDPSATKGVFMAYDSSTTGHSLVGTPGRRGGEFKTGDWMIRIELDRPAEADALNGD